jgi:hypothetical protein
MDARKRLNVALYVLFSYFSFNSVLRNKRCKYARVLYNGIEMFITNIHHRGVGYFSHLRGIHSYTVLKSHTDDEGMLINITIIVKDSVGLATKALNKIQNLMA